MAVVFPPSRRCQAPADLTVSAAGRQDPGSRRNRSPPTPTAPSSQQISPVLPGTVVVPQRPPDVGLLLIPGAPGSLVTTQAEYRGQIRACKAVDTGSIPVASFRPCSRICLAVTRHRR